MAKDTSALRRRAQSLARDAGEQILLARLLDRFEESARKDILTAGPFLGQTLQESCRLLFADEADPKLVLWGGYEEAERCLPCFLPNWMDEEDLPLYLTDRLACVRLDFPSGTDLSHRDFLGSLVGLGLDRDSIGDILIDPEAGRCDLVLLREAAMLVLSEYRQAGRVPVEASAIAPAELQVPPRRSETIRISVASPRLEAVISDVFHLARSKAADLVRLGSVIRNGRMEDKPDRLVAAGDSISSRGLGKFRVLELGQPTKKGRIPVVIEKYL